jgi:hypothetical protein
VCFRSDLKLLVSHFLNGLANRLLLVITVYEINSRSSATDCKRCEIDSRLTDKDDGRCVRSCVGGVGSS